MVNNVELKLSKIRYRMMEKNIWSGLPLIKRRQKHFQHCFESMLIKSSKPGRPIKKEEAKSSSRIYLFSDHKVHS